MLGWRLREYRGSDCMVLAIPSGGVTVAVEATRIASLPLDLLIARKVQIPRNPEAGFGAVAPDGGTLFNDALLRQLGLGKEEIEGQVRLSMASIEHRNALFRGGAPPPDVEMKCVVLIDDGLASGFTMRVSVQ